jgi:hypothetical protein
MDYLEAGAKASKDRSSASKMSQGEQEKTGR